MIGVSVSRTILSLANAVAQATPLTRWFPIRQYLYARAGVGVAGSAKLCGGVRIVHANATIGMGTWLGIGCELLPTRASSVTIGNRCDIGPGVMFVVGSHRIGPTARRAGAGTSSPISVGDGSWVGARSTFLGGGAVGCGCIVAAGSLVTDSFPDNVLVAGVPARIVRELPEETEE